jgi:hypothetical protein
MLCEELEVMSASGWLLFLVLLISLNGAGRAQDVPLDNCKQLPMVKATVGKRQFQFLVDTGSGYTLLNQKSFPSPDTTEIMMESWNGREGAQAHVVVLPDFRIGEDALYNLKLLAVDLTAVERSCEKRVDGVLGADLIAKLGLTIDLKNRMATLDASTKAPQARFAELDQQQAACESAFNHSDEKAFEQCLDPDVVLLTSQADYRGRSAVMKYFRECYFGQSPQVQVSIAPRQRHLIGAVIWIEYDMSVTVRDQVMKVHGTALYRKNRERWLMSNMNYSMDERGR